MYPSSALSVALGRLDSDSIWDVHVTMCVEYMVWFKHCVYFCINIQTLSTRASKSWVGDREWGLHKIVAANAANVALGTEILISKFAQLRKRQTLQSGPNYATLVWHYPVLCLQTTNTHISSLHKHAAAQKLVRPLPEQLDRLHRPCI